MASTPIIVITNVRNSDPIVTSGRPLPRYGRSPAAGASRRGNRRRYQGRRTTAATFSWAPQRRQKLRPTLFPAAQLGQVMPVSYVSVGTGGFTVRTDGLCLTVTWSVGDRTSVPGSRGSGVAGVTAEVVDVGVWLVVGGV